MTETGVGDSTPATTDDSTRTVDDYRDIRDIHPDWRWHECWHCGHRWRVRRPVDKRLCRHCFFGQEQLDSDDPRVTGNAPTKQGYINYRELWYGDVSPAEARRRFGETKQEISKRGAAAVDREVRL
jgi:NMD protein affecting ribosome stability and mRNA decay